MENASLRQVLAAVLVGASVLVLVVFWKLLRSVLGEKCNGQQHKPTKMEKKKDQQQQHQNHPKAKKRHTENKWSARTEKQNFSHQWLLTSLKGHTGQVLDIDFSSTGKYLVSSADDRTVLLWDTKDLLQKDRRSLRVNIEFDHGTFVKFSPDSKAFIIHRFNENAVEVYKVEKKKDGWLAQPTKALTFPKAHETDVIGMGIASTGKFIMTCSNKTDLVIWDLRGEQLAQVDTYLMSTLSAKISPCGRFVAATGFAPDAKVWEVLFTKSGEFQEVKRVFELSGHRSGVYDVAFDVDSSHMATVSKDGTWKLFDTKIEYKKGESPHLLTTGVYEQSSAQTLIALSPNSEVVVIASGNSLEFFSTKTGKRDGFIQGIYPGNIASILFDSSGKYLLTAGDKHIRVFHNVTGYRCAIETAKEKLKEAQTSATKERLKKLIADYQGFMNTIEK